MDAVFKERGKLDLPMFHPVSPHPTRHIVTLTDESCQKVLTTLSVGSAMLFQLTHDAFKAYSLPQSLLLEVHPVSSPALIAESPCTVLAALKTVLCHA